MTTATREVTVRLRQPHPAQAQVVDCPARRIIIRAGRRGGKTVAVSLRAVTRFLDGRRQLYTAPTQEQVDAFWYEVKAALAEPIEAGVFHKNESLHLIELPGTKQRIRAKTSWSPDMLRGDFADDLYIDEWQLCDEEMWELVGQPMLLDNDGDALFVYTPPSLHSRSVSKAHDPRHAARMFAQAQADTSGRWAAFHWASAANPYISEAALGQLSQDMTRLAYRQEILAEDVDEAPGALWTRALLDASRVLSYPPLSRVVVGVDPPGGVVECGIVVAGLGMVGGNPHVYTVEDRSLRASPDRWAAEVLLAVSRNQADCVVGETNYGGDMVKATIQTAAKARNETYRYKAVQATRGKAVRAEPIVALWEQGRAHLVGNYPQLEDELCQWVPGETRESPNRLDALVWAVSELLPTGGGNVRFLP